MVPAARKWFQVQPVFNKAILGVGFSIGKTHKDIYCVPFFFGPDFMAISDSITAIDFMSSPSTFVGKEQK